MLDSILLCTAVITALVSYFYVPLRRPMAIASIVLFTANSVYLLIDSLGVWSVLLFVVSLFQMVNIARLIKGRLHERYMRNAFFIGGGRLMAMQLILWTLIKLDVEVMKIGVFAGYAQLVCGAAILVLVLLQLKYTKPKNINQFYTDHELPSISILIPARNENQDLQDVLESVTSSDYPKLEILVLDDCSVGRHIPDIVKQYAHAGVRFIQGEPPLNNWLAKNQAYKTLADQASGSWLVFMGVDVRLGVGSLKALVHYAENNSVSMVSVLPRRTNTPFWSGFFSPLRYFREFLKSGRFGISAPALSTLWLIRADSYRALGGIESVARKIIPEHYFANILHSKRDYAFVRTNDYLEVSTSKQLSEQIKTSIRVIYPSLHRQVEQVLMSTFGMALFLVMPYVQLVYALAQGETVHVVLAVATVAALSLSHLIIVLVTNPIVWPFALFNFPYLVLQEIVLGLVSMFKYEFGEVDWKGRNACLPVMHVVPRLPRLENTPEH